MPEKTIEAIIASPPEYDELIVQLFLKDGDQWADIYRKDGLYWIEFGGVLMDQVRLPLEELIHVLSLAHSELRLRLEGK